MVDAEAVILEELDRLAPPERGDGADWAAVEQRAGTRHPGRRGRRTLAFAVPIVAIALLAPAFTFSAGVRSLLGFAPHFPRPEFAKAHLLVSAPIGNGYFVHIWRAPTPTGSNCSFVSASRWPATPVISARAVRGAVLCSKAHIILNTTAARPIEASVEMTTRKADSSAWLPPFIQGSVYPALHAARIELDWRGGSKALTLHGDLFAGGGPELYKPPFPTLPYRIVAYDAREREVARLKLPNPSFYFGGWHSFETAYRTWKKAHPNGK